MGYQSTKQVWFAYAMGITSGILCAMIYQRTQAPKLDADLRQYSEVRDFVQRNFVRPIDHQDILDRSLHGMARSLDPYSRFYDAEESAQLENETAGNYRGIGIVMRRMQGKQRVLFCMPDSPADRAGLRTGDELVQIDGDPVEELTSAGFGERMRGLAGTSVRLRALHLDGTEVEVSIERDLVINPSVRHFEMLEGTPGIAYLNIHTFSRRTGVEFDQALSHLDSMGMKALILDLRGNLGGVMDSALSIARRLIPEGLLLRTEGKQQIETHHAKTGDAIWKDLPVVVLVDGDSASASEILAGALQDYRRAAIVGMPTYGKGMVQTIRRFPEFKTKVKVTSAYYYTPSGRLFERSSEEGRDHGLVPDVQIDLDNGAQREVDGYLASYGAPMESRADIQAWEKETDQSIMPRVPRNEQINAAIQLLLGQHPTIERTAKR
ncbi:MAG: S41 family peptidase [Planctomycetota bacterium]|nr:S41 family peptidase [Planctomycetota bacterium]